jgi:hypothetical protein
VSTVALLDASFARNGSTLSVQLPRRRIVSNQPCAYRQWWWRWGYNIPDWACPLPSFVYLSGDGLDQRSFSKERTLGQEPKRWTGKSFDLHLTLDDEVHFGTIVTFVENLFRASTEEVKMLMDKQHEVH